MFCGTWVCAVKCTIDSAPNHMHDHCHFEDKEPVNVLIITLQQILPFSYLPPLIVSRFHLSDISEYTSKDRYLYGNLLQTLHNLC